MEIRFVRFPPENWVDTSLHLLKMRCIKEHLRVPSLTRKRGRVYFKNCSQWWLVNYLLLRIVHKIYNKNQPFSNGVFPFFFLLHGGVLSFTTSSECISLDVHNNHIIKIVFIHVENISVLEFEIFHRNVTDRIR